MAIKTIFEVLKEEEKEQEFESYEIINLGEWVEIDSTFDIPSCDLILIMEDKQFLYYLRIASNLRNNCLYRVKKGDD